MALFQNPFAEKAEFLTDNEVLNSFQETPQDAEVLKNLFDSSPRVLLGARGSGKSMLMKRALLDSRSSPSKPLCLYVNFQRYLRLEPLVYETANALSVFRAWVISKTFLAAVEEVKDNREQLLQILSAIDLSETDIKPFRNFVEELEGSVLVKATSLGSDLPQLSVAKVIKAIDLLREIRGRKRSVLLMDDAAHAFSTEFQEEFFEIFRLFRTPSLAAKAAVYPGATHYGRNFNPGHDARETRIERDITSPEYEDFILEILRARLSVKDFRRLERDDAMLTILCYAASGNPRAAIVMAAGALELAGSRPPQKNHYTAAIDSYSDYMWKQHESLKRRLPRFEAQVSAGTSFIHALTLSLRELNKHSRSRQTTSFAVEEGVPTEFEKLLDLLQYSGIVQLRTTVRRGRTRPLIRYQLNLCLAIAQGVFIGERGAAVPITPERLRHLPRKRYKMFSKDSAEVSRALENTDDALPPCPKCGRHRLVPDARFCSYCGAELLERSIYLELLSAPVSSLPIPELKAEALSEQGLSTIKDILMDSDGRRLRRARSVGTVWAARIKKLADEFLEG